MSGPVRVLWLTKGLGWGGAERLLAACARHASRDRWEIEVAYVLPWKSGLVPEIESLGVPVHCLGQERPRGAWPVRLRRLIAVRDYAIVHTHAPVPAVAARLLGGGRARLVHTEHNMWPRYRPTTRWANALTYRRNDAVIAVSKAVAGTIRPPGRGIQVPLTVVIHGIEHPVPTLSRRVARSRLGLPEDGLVVGTVGNLTPKKDHRTLLDTVAVLPEASRPTLVIVGTGPMDRELRAHARSLGIADSVIFAGLRQDVTEILPAFDVFVLSSRHEGLPLALVEAMAAGVPVVATEVGGIPEIVTDGVEGVLVRPGAPHELAAVLAGLLADAEARGRLAATGHERARTLDIATAQRQIEDVYAAVLATPANARERR